MMDDFLKRSILTFVGLSLAILAIAQAMAANGSASPRNPAWQFVSALRGFFIWTWIGLCVAALIAGFFLILSERRCLASLRDDPAKAKQAETVAEADYQRHQLERERRSSEIEEAKRAQAEAMAWENEEREKSELRNKQTRSHEQAVKAALDEF